jgi:integrase
VRETLTDVKVKRLKAAPPGKRYDVWDALVPGLSIRVTDRAQKSWTIVGRLRGKPLRVKVGTYPAIGVAAARRLARSAIEDLAAGKHPKYGRPEIALVSKAFGLFVEGKQSGWSKAYLAGVRSAERLYIKPALGNLLVDQVSRRHVAAMIAPIAAEHPARANTILSHVSAFFRWCLERELVSQNPAAFMQPSNEKSRDRVYSDAELRAIWKASEAALSWPYGPFVRFLLVTAQRRAQVRDMKWAEIDEARGLWTSRTKENRLHPLPLADLANEILADAHRLGEYVFSSTGKRGLSNMSYLARKIREAPGTPKDFRLHDLRRTAATRMAEIGVKPWVIDAILDHVAGGVSGIYNRYSYLDEMRQALSLWSLRLRKILAVR